MKRVLKIVLAICASVCVYAGTASYSWAAPLGQAAAAPQSAQKPAAPAAGQPGQTGQPAQPAGPTMTPEERQAFQDLASEASAGLDPERVLKLADDFEKKYPSSPMLSGVYTFEASAYEAKNDLPKVVEAGEKSLKLNGDNLSSLLILSSVLPQPQVAKGDDKEKKLNEAEADANHALELITQGKYIPKGANETDDAYKKRTNAIASEPHASLGMVHLQRATLALGGGMDQSELTKAAQEFKQSVEMTDHPEPQHYYRLGEVYKHQNKIDDAIAAFSKASELSQGTGLQQYADKQIDELKKAKAAGSH